MIVGILAFVMIGGALAVAGFMLFGGSKHSVHDRLAALDAGAGIADEKNAIMRFVNAQQAKFLTQRFAEAGWYTMTPAKYVMSSVVAGAIGFGASMAVAFLLHPNLAFMLLITGVITVAGFYYPSFGLTRAVEARKVAIQRSLPDFLDLVSSTVEAGIALNGAIGIAADGLEGALAEELRATLQDIRLGRSRGEALSAAAQRVKEPAFTSTIMAIVQADKLGGNVADVLAELAIDAREHRIMRAEELANALPNKLVFPMALFMLPSLFVVIFGAVFVNLMSGK